jgi:diguanylate cyclase (GGDEF)-like protein/PAS domain S-box-containing protein
MESDSNSARIDERDCVTGSTRSTGVSAAPVADPAHTGAAREASNTDPALLALVARHTDDGVVVTDCNGCVEWINDALTTITGWRIDDLRGKPPAELLHGAETNQLAGRSLVQALERGSAYHADLLSYRRDGSKLWLETQVHPVVGADGRMTHCLSILRDVTVKRAAAQRIAELTAAAQRATDGMAVLDRSHFFRLANDAFARLFGYTNGSELWGKAWRSLYDRAQARRFEAEILPALLRDRQWQGTVQARRRDGSTYPQHLTLVRAGGGSTVFVAHDASDQPPLDQAELQQALMDPLTGLRNREGLWVLAEHQLRMARRSPRPCVLFYLDLDGFDAMQRDNANELTDEALKEFAGVMRRSFRSSDILSRIGGDEFVALAIDCDAGYEDTVVERVAQRVARENERPDRRYTLSATCAYACFSTTDPKTLDQLLREADARLSEKKNQRVGRQPLKTDN